MKRWLVPLASLSTVAGVIVLALFLAGVFDGDDAAKAGVGGSESAGLCAEDTPDCEDTLVEPGSAGDDGEGASSAPVCAPGFPDCVDTVVNDDEAGEPVGGQGGISISPVCAPGFPDCVDMIVNDANGDIDDAEPPTDPIVPADGQCSGDEFASCEELAIDAALADAARLFGDGESEINVVVESAAVQEWSNSCLDAADEGELCAEVITPGFVIVIEIEGTQYEYHTDLNGNVRLAI